MDNKNLSLGDMASALGGAGLTQVSTDLYVGLLLVGIAVALKVLVAVLAKNDIPVQAPPLRG